MSKPDPRPQLAQRSAILQAAAGLIAAEGYHGMTMRSLAKATGRSLAAVYNYYGSKEEILFALQKEAFETLIAAADGALHDVGDPEARLYVFISHHVHYFAAHPDVMRVLVHEAASLPPPRRRVVRELKERYFRIARDIVQASREAGAFEEPAEADLERVTYSLFGMLNWIYGWYEPDRHGSPHEVARTIHRIALAGLLADGGPLQGLQSTMDQHLASLAAPPLLGSADLRGQTP
ncbi:MAG: TetR/AcrR family transcriptional regulator [Myxococcota bacterium]